MRQYLNRLNRNAKSELESKTVTDSSLLSGTIDNENYEIIEEDERSMSRTELTEDYKNETENEESSSNSLPNVLDERKVLILTTGADLPNPINVLYECHICFDTFNSVSLSEEHMAEFHATEIDSKNDTLDAMIVDIDATCQQQITEHNHSNDNGNFCYKTEQVTLSDVAEVHIETTAVVLDDEEAVKTDDEIVPVIVVTGNETTELKFNCQKCGGKFAKERSLNIHIKLNKCTIKSFECGICKKVFVRKKNLDSHMRTHDEPSEYSCKVCSQTFELAEKLAVHIQTEHEPSRKYLCPHCWKGW